MLIISMLFLTAVFIMNEVYSDNSEQIMKDFCKFECKNDIKNKHKFCC